MKKAMGRLVLFASGSAFVLIIVSATASAALPGTTRESTPPLSESWTPTDFTTATCGYIARPLGLTFLLPPGFMTRNPKHGAGNGCFWGTEEDLNRALLPRAEDFEYLTRGLFQARLSTNLGWDPAKRRFGGEAEMSGALAATGVKDAKVLRRNFGPFAGLVITGRTATADLYMLYLADRDADRVVLISYRPPTVVRTGTEPAATWQRFLDSIH
jgi:hypothetical protein